MDNSTLAKVYGVVGAALFAFSINLFWLERTGVAILDAIQPHTQLPSAILIGEFAITIVGLFVLFVADRHWKGNPTEPWIVRLPSAFIEPPNPRDPLAAFIRIVGFVAFVVVPAYISGHFLRYLGGHGVIDRQDVINGLEFWTPTWAFFEPGTFSGENRFRFENRDGVAFFPFIEAVLLGFLVATQCMWTMFFFFRLSLAGLGRLKRGHPTSEG